MTAHGSKGLEFENVFIIKAFHGNWGGRMSRQLIKLPPQLLTLAQQPESKEVKKDLETEDERRLFFVAATRAKKRLFVTTANQYGDAKNTREVEASQFITELSDNVYENLEAEKILPPTEQRLQQNLQPIIKKDLSTAEEAFLKALVSKFRLSASALNEYLECPLKFKFNRLLKAPIPASPHIALGNAVHKALEKQGRALMNGEKLSEEKLLTDFEQALNNELLSGEDYLLTLTEGRGILQKYFQTYQDTWQAPAAVEYNFGRHNVVLELPEQEPIVLSGKIDKLEWVDQQTSRVKIIDFKTSSYKTENQIRGLTKAADKNIWRQLVFYVLMANLDNQFRPPNKMQKYQVDHVEVDFLKETRGKLHRVAIVINQDDVHELTLEIADVIQAIRNLDFYGTEKYPLCKECEYCQQVTSCTK